MACARPSPTPNPNAMKFTLDITLPARIHVNCGDETDDPFARAVLALDGVASVFGVNDFVTITRVPDADWDPIVCAVEEAAERHLPNPPAGPVVDDIEAARKLLRDAVAKPPRTPLEIRDRRNLPSGT